jgi:tetratricopeptide (TPR) repeat protein
MKFLLSVSAVLMRASVALVASQFIGTVIYGDDISFAQGNRSRILQALGAGSSVQNYVADNQNNSGDGTGALTNYDRVIELNPNNPKAYFDRGLHRKKLGDRQGAIKDLDEAIRLDPKEADAYRSRGDIRHSLGDNLGAIKDYDESVRLNPKDYIAYSFRANARLSWKDRQGAIEDFSEAIRLNPNLAEAYEVRGMVRNLLGDFEGAVKDLEAAAVLAKKQNNQSLYKSIKFNLNLIRSSRGIPATPRPPQ